MTVTVTVTVTVTAFKHWQITVNRGVKNGNPK